VAPQSELKYEEVDFFERVRGTRRDVEKVLRIGYDANGLLGSLEVDGLRRASVMVSQGVVLTVSTIVQEPGIRRMLGLPSLETGRVEAPQPVMRYLQAINPVISAFTDAEKVAALTPRNVTPPHTNGAPRIERRARPPKLGDLVLTAEVVQAPVVEEVVQAAEPIAEVVVEEVVQAAEPIAEVVVEEVVQAAEPIVEPVAEPVVEEVVQAAEPIDILETAMENLLAASRHDKEQGVEPSEEVRAARSKEWSAAVDQHLNERYPTHPLPEGPEAVADIDPADLTELEMHRLLHLIAQLPEMIGGEFQHDVLTGDGRGIIEAGVKVTYQHLVNLVYHREGVTGDDEELVLIRMALEEGDATFVPGPDPTPETEEMRRKRNALERAK
jgi:hypothetical protein